LGVQPFAVHDGMPGGLGQFCAQPGSRQLLAHEHRRATDVRFVRRDRADARNAQQRRERCDGVGLVSFQEADDRFHEVSLQRKSVTGWRVFILWTVEVETWPTQLASARTLAASATKFYSEPLEE